MKNTLINRAATRKIAMALGELNEQVVFVDGAVVSLYIDDPSADDVRPTKEIDISMEITSLSQLEEIRETIYFEKQDLHFKKILKLLKDTIDGIHRTQ